MTQHTSPAGHPDNLAAAGSPQGRQDNHPGHTPASPLDTLGTLDTQDTYPGAYPTVVDNVQLVDSPGRRVHRPSDLVWIIASALAIVLVMLMAAYAHETTDGITKDIHSFANLLGRVLFVPVSLLEGIVVVAVPLAVLIELGVRRLARQLIDAVIGALAGLGLALAMSRLITHFATPHLLQSLSITDSTNTNFRLTIPATIAALAALLQVAGPRARRRTARWGGNAVTFLIIVVVVTNMVSLPGALIALLLGTMAAQGVQYISGVRSERAYGPDLITAIRRAGFEPVDIKRVPEPAGMAASRAYRMTATQVDSGPRTMAIPALSGHKAASKPAPVGGDSRVYTVAVLDGDRNVVGIVSRWWRALRLRGWDNYGGISLKAASDHTALMLYAAHAAGVRVSQPLGMGMAADSALLVLDYIDAPSLWDISQAQVGAQVAQGPAQADGRQASAAEQDSPAQTEPAQTGPLDNSSQDNRPPGTSPTHTSPLADAVLDDMWRQLLRAHTAGLAHRNITAHSLAVDTSSSRTWITGWQQGETNASPLTQHLDLVQLLAALAVTVGSTRAVESAARNLPHEDMLSLGPLIQSIALPQDTRSHMRNHRKLLLGLRDALVDHLPGANVAPQPLTRFSVKTIIMAVVTIIAISVVVTTFNLDQIATAIRHANPWWTLAALLFAAMPWFCQAVTHVAFAPGRLPLGRTTLAQMATSFVTLATPAGIGPVAVNLRYFTQQGMSTPTAVATAGLAQVTQVLVTVAMLLVVVVGSGSGGLIETPSTTMIIAVALVLAIVVALLLVAPIRRWVWSKAQPMFSQVWPRLSSLISQPLRFSIGMLGNLVEAVTYVMAFYASMLAFGVNLRFADVAVIYLVGNTVGAFIPTPGGIGGVEGALVAGLTAAGVPAAIAFSITMLFRVVSYWIQIPIGWFAMHHLQKHGNL